MRPLMKQKDDPVDVVLDYYNGNARVAIETLLEDCRHLRKQLALTEGAMSRGFTRGWSPVFERT